jgi:hypothetical protein
MTNLMHKFLNLFYLSIYFFLTCFGLSFSPSSVAGVQLPLWFKSAGYGVSVRARMELLNWSLYNFMIIKVWSFHCEKDCEVFWSVKQRILSEWNRVTFRQLSLLPSSEIYMMSAASSVVFIYTVIFMDSLFLRYYVVTNFYVPKNFPVRIHDLRKFRN